MRYWLFLTLLSVALPAQAEQKLRVVSWSGAYLRSQMLGFIRPYEEATGVDVEVLQYTGGLDEIRSQVRSYNVKWDVVDLELFDALQACEEGLLHTIDPAMLTPGANGTPARKDFIDGSLMDCGVGNVLFSTVVAYDRDRVERAPRTIEDFFDVDAIPGSRGMRRTPMVNLEWALIADGVSADRVYDVLDTKEGVDRAFDVLTRLKPYIVWWETGEEAIRLLERGKVSMTSAYSGRVHDAVQGGASFEVLWDHQVWFIDVWGIVRHTENLELAKDFIRFASTTESLARQARHITYGPARKSATDRVPEETRHLLPTAEPNFRTAIEGNAGWWAARRDDLTDRFERWAERPLMVPQRTPR